VLKKIKRLTSGGRSLNAIHLNKKLNQIEKHLMLVLAGLLDFRGLDEECSFGDAVLTIPIAQIAIRMSMSKRNVTTYINNLSTKGYVTKNQNYSPDDKRQLESTYMLTDQIFVEFAQELGLELEAMSSCGGCTTFTPPMHDVPYNIPYSLFNDPPSEKKKNNKDQKSCVGRSPSLCQKDTHIINNLDDSFAPEEIPNKIPPETKLQTPQQPKIVKLRVTPQHNHMVKMFTPMPRLKSFVHRNTILSFTDDLINDYGDFALKVIDQLYADFVNEELCGTFKWIQNDTLKFFHQAYDKVIEKQNRKNKL
jgi:DNA-binding MarR family transcriptional regulator